MLLFSVRGTFWNLYYSLMCKQLHWSTSLIPPCCAHCVKTSCCKHCLFQAPSPKGIFLCGIATLLTENSRYSWKKKSYFYRFCITFDYIHTPMTQQCVCALSVVLNLAAVSPAEDLNMSCNYQMSDKSVTCDWSLETNIYTETVSSLIFSR